MTKEREPKRFNSWPKHGGAVPGGKVWGKTTMPKVCRSIVVWKYEPDRVTLVKRADAR